MYDFYLGGRDNYEVDREAAQRVIDFFPDIVPTTRANRQFMHRAVRHLVRAGIRQIIDIGTGIPTAPNTHQVAQEVAPDVRVAYIDNDPIVATHAGAHLLGTGNTGFFLGDMRDPDAILGHPTIGKLIDFDQPVGLLLVAVVHFLPDDAEAAALIAAYRDALPAGSMFVLTHATEDFHSVEAGMGEARDVYRQRGATATVTTRRYEQILPFFDGYDLVDPGLVQIPLWHPDGELPTAEELSHVGTYGGIGVKL
ncbi:SAM-dependent methyltransferase [Streptomyces sp. PRB2-1]|jgi:hypothetical protein|uniref:SAM-dependent methyltransferase n=2 Tax=Actinacidiphila epipremni TaxID=2053013 RepID=A0ABX0ZNB9_9ACTN|nr:SAM-dependent methyltransferase [Actinacidiphila epipremni]